MPETNTHRRPGVDYEASERATKLVNDLRDAREGVTRGEGFTMREQTDQPASGLTKVEFRPGATNIEEDKLSEE